MVAKLSRLALLSLLVISFGICLPPTNRTLADDFTWTGAGNGNWNSPDNWQNDTPGGTAVIPDGDDNASFAIDAQLTNGAALALTNSATLTVANNNTVLLGADVTNTGEITFVEPNGFVERIRITADLAFNGTGEVVLRHVSESVLEANAAGLVLTNGVDHTIRGTGNLNTSVINLNEIYAEGGVLQLQGETVDNATGQIIVGDEAGLSMAIGTVLSGGTIIAPPVVGSLNGGTLKDLTITGGTLAVVNNSLVRLDGTITNNATLTYVEPNSFTERYRLVGDTTLAGSGTLLLKDRNESLVDTLDGAQTLTNGPDHTVRGAGGISASMVNQGQIVAENGSLRLLGATVDNAAGEIEIGTSGALELGGTITGGIMRATATGNQISGGTLKDLTLESGSFIQANNSLTSLEGTITNNATLTYVEPNSFVERYRLAADTTLAGTGELVMRDTNESLLDTVDQSHILTNGPEHTIRGLGTISADIINNGTIRPETGRLRLTGTGGVNNTAGSIVFGTNGQLQLAGVVDGGSIEATAAGNQIFGGGLKDVTLTSGTLIVGNNNTVTIEGAVTNNGTITYVSPAGFGERLRLAGNTTLSGNGQLIMQDINESQIDSADAAFVLTNGTDHTLGGTGRVGVERIINQGTIAPSAGQLRLLGTGGVDNTSGTIRFGERGNLQLAGVVTGGMIEATAVGNQIAGGGLKDLTVSAGKLIVGNNTTVTLEGTITNNGHVTFVQPTGFGDRLRLATDVTLEGTGKLMMTSRSESIIDTANGTELLTSGTSHTLGGNGRIFADVISNGTMNPGIDLDLTGSYEQTSTSTSLVNNFGLNDWSELTVSTTAAVDGEIVVDYLGIIPVGTIEIDVLRADEITGTFDDISVVDTLPWVGTASFEILADEFGTTDVVRVTVINTASGLDGDYNNDGTVDAADYTVWRDNLGQSLDMPNDTTLGTITTEDYEVWKTNFGVTLASSVAGQSVPEPSGMLVIALVVLAVTASRRSGCAGLQVCCACNIRHKTLCIGKSNIST